MQVYTNRIPKMTFAYIYNIKAVWNFFQLNIEFNETYY